MNKEKKNILSQLRSIIHRYQFILLAIIVGGIGVWLIVTPQSLPFPNVANDLGVAFLAAGTIGLALEFYTRRQFLYLMKQELVDAVNQSTLYKKIDEILARGSLGGDLRELGVRRIHRERNAIDFTKLINEAEKGTEIRILGVCLAGFMDRQTQVLLKKKLTEGCNIRLLIIDPESDFVKHRAMEENRIYEDIKQDISAADVIHKNFIQRRLPQNLRDKIELGHYNSAPAYFIFCTQSTMIVGFYLREGLGEFFPQLEIEIKGGGIHSSFGKHFEAVWRTRNEAPKLSPSQTQESMPANNALQSDACDDIP